MFAFVQALFLIAFPMLAIFLAGRFKLFNIIGPVVLCYLGGVALALTPGLPTSVALSDGISSAVVPLAIPLLLFSTDFVGWIKFAGKAVLSFGLALVSVVVASVGVFFVLGDTIDRAADISGMLIGVYSGGTPNMASIGKALDVPENSYLLIQTSDVLVGGIYLIFLLSVAQRFLLLFLKPFKAPEGASGNHFLDSHDVESLRWSDAPPILKGGLLSILIVGLSAGLALGVGELFQLEHSFVPVVLLGLTTLAILSSFSPAIRALRGTYEAGEYLILIFCVAMGSMVEPGNLFATGQQYLLYCGLTMVSAILLHMFLGWIFRIDADTLLITSTAAIYGPPFIPPVCEAIKNRHLLISGLTTGLVGYSVGNYLGLAVAGFLRA